MATWSSMASQTPTGPMTLTLHTQSPGTYSSPTMVQHLAWLRTVFEELGHPQQLPTDLGNDNMAAIILSKDSQFRARTKHIQRKYHFVRDDLIEKGEAIIRYVPTDDMVADIFTKALPHDKHWKFVTAMGLRLCSSGRVKICRS